MKVFTVATGQLAAVCKVEGKKVCWNTKGNKLAIVTNDEDDKKYEGCNILIFDMWMGYVQKKTTSTSPPTESCWPAEVPR